MIDLNSLVGLTEVEALDEIAHNNMKVRIRNRDGQAFMGTCDYRMDRVNLNIKNNLVVSATIG